MDNRSSKIQPRKETGVETRCAGYEVDIRVRENESALRALCEVSPMLPSGHMPNPAHSRPSRPCPIAGSFFFFFFCVLGPHLWHREVPRLGVQLELQLSAYTTATATPDPSRVCDLHHSSQQRKILNPLSEARDRTRNLVVPSRIHFHCTMMGTPHGWLCSRSLHLLELLLILLHLADLAQISFPRGTCPCLLPFSPSSKLSASLALQPNCIHLNFRTNHVGIKLAVLHESLCKL